MKKIIVAIDGFSGTGKSSTARKVAEILGYHYVDSGAMYRAVTLYFLRKNVNLKNEEAVQKALAEMEIDFRKQSQDDLSHIYINGEDVENVIRMQRVSDYVSQVAALTKVRKDLVSKQQQLGKTRGIVMDGRDIGTVVFPDAELKVFMTADDEVRAKRRVKELIGKGHPTELKDVLDNLKKRDLVDTTRADSPLTKAEDAIEIDTTNLTFEEQVHKIVDLAEEIIG
jgi:cytidylate kinase